MDQILTVSQVNGYLKQLLDEDVQLKSIFIRGEISNFTNHLKTGHYYFTLKDQKASIKGIMFKWNTQHLRFMPQNGMNVIIFGSVQLFERDGICQIYCADMQPDGVGGLYMAFEQLKEKLDRQGVFDEEHKKPLPPMPSRIGVITAKTGAAIHDILNILSRRYPIGEVVLIPALVQGENAPDSICDAIGKAEELDLDVLIVGRGGGSLEDLWAFNDERVAYAIYNCTIPVISAVGHEVDYTIADFVADLRAPTPSAAAELVAPDVQNIMQAAALMGQELKTAMLDILRDKSDELEALRNHLQAKSPEAVVERSEEQLGSLNNRLTAAAEQAAKVKSITFMGLAGKLEALSPLKVLTRGYSITFLGEKTIASVKEVADGDEIRTQVSDGTIVSTVTKTEWSKGAALKTAE